MKTLSQHITESLQVNEAKQIYKIIGNVTQFSELKVGDLFELANESAFGYEKQNDEYAYKIDDSGNTTSKSRKLRKDHPVYKIQMLSESSHKVKTSHIAFKDLGIKNLKDINNAIKAFDRKVGGWMQKDQGFKFDSVKDARIAYDALMNDGE